MTYPNELTNPAQSNWPVRVNEALKSFRGYGLYAPNDLTTTGLTLGYFGGYLDDSVTISDGTVGPLAASDTSYVVAHRTTGAVTHATTTTNWDNTTTYGRLFSIDTGGSSITTIRDWRLLSGGFFGGGGAGAVDASAVSYTPGDLDDWTASDDPGNVDDALDQLADRVSAVEESGAAGGSVATDTIWDAKGDLAGGTGSNTAARLPVGANGLNLEADSTQATGLKWAHVFGWFNVKVYGALGDGSTDDTAFIQDAIDAAEAAGGGVVYFPVGVYVVNGALQDTGRSNSQLLLPRRDCLDTEQITIEFVGAFAPPPIISVIGTTPLPDNQSVIKGTLNAGAGGAMIGAQGPVGTFELFTNLCFKTRNITYRMPANPVLTALNLLKVTAVEIDGIVVDTGSYDVAALSAQTTATSYGIQLPDINNGAQVKLGTVNVVGFYKGIRVNEHTNAANVNVWGCLQAVECPAANHASIFQRLGIYHCARGIVGTGGDSWLNITQFNIEHAASGTWAPVYDLDDASNYLNGRIHAWHTVLAGTGADSTLLVNGATKLRRRRINADRTATLTDAATINTDCNLANNFSVTLGGNRTLANPTALQDGEVYNWRITQDGTGSRTLAYGSKFKFPGGAPTLSTAASAKDFISCQYDADDDTLFCAIVKAMA